MKCNCQSKMTKYGLKIHIKEGENVYISRGWIVNQSGYTSLVINSIISRLRDVIESVEIKT